ncbi:MAG: hypothetical protein ACPGWM_07080, partial [Flavobacteriales bacterium]
MIKQFIGTLCFCFTVLMSLAQAHNDAAVVQDTKYWTDQVAVNPNNNNAWINLYFTKRNDLEQSTAKDLSKTHLNELIQIEEEIEVVLPNSAALGYVQYLNSNFTDDAALQQAINLEPNNTLIQEQTVNMATI